MFSFDHIDDSVEIAQICIGSDKGRWWGNPEFGSRLWILEKGKINEETPRLVKEALLDAVGWMQAEGLIEAVAVKVDRPEKRRINWQVILTLPDGKETKIKGGWSDGS